MSYSTSKEILEYLGKDAYYVVRDEVLGTGNGTASSWTTSQVNLVSTSVTLYTNSAEYTGSYTIDLDTGEIQYTVSNGVTLSATYYHADVPDSQMQKIIASADSLIESKTGRTFTTTTANTEYITTDAEIKTLWLKNYPVLTFSSLSLRDDETFTALTAGYTEDYIEPTDEDLRIGRIRLTESVEAGEDRFKAIYDYGYATTPNLIAELSKLLAIRQMANSAVYKSIFKGNDNFTPVRLEEIENRIEELFRLNTRQDISSI